MVGDSKSIISRVLAQGSKSFTWHTAHVQKSRGERGGQKTKQRIAKRRSDALWECTAACASNPQSWQCPLGLNTQVRLKPGSRAERRRRSGRGPVMREGSSLVLVLEMEPRKRAALMSRALRRVIASLARTFPGHT